MGILEMLWHFTAEFAHAGDVGRFTDDAIAKALCWDGASTELVSSLVDAGWLDRCECHRLRVHDWPDHADQTVERVLSKRGQGFLSCFPNASIKLADASTVLTKTSQPSPSPSPSPSPGPSPLPPRSSAKDAPRVSPSEIVMWDRRLKNIAERMKTIRARQPLTADEKSELALLKTEKGVIERKQREQCLK